VGFQTQIYSPTSASSLAKYLVHVPQTSVTSDNNDIAAFGCDFLYRKNIASGKALAPVSRSTPGFAVLLPRFLKQDC
jgi:hypothetical protein